MEHKINTMLFKHVEIRIQTIQGNFDVSLTLQSHHTDWLQISGEGRGKSDDWEETN